MMPDVDLALLWGGLKSSQDESDIQFCKEAAAELSLRSKARKK